MNRFVLIFVATNFFVFGIGQACFAQIQILDGDGKQVMSNVIPAEKADPPAAELVPGANPEIFGGNGRSIIIRKSFSSFDDNGDLKTESSGKAIVIGPDGKRQEFDLKGGENLDLNLDFDFGPMRVDGLGLMPGPSAKKQTASFSIGVQSQPIHPAVASQLKLESGLMVSQVTPESPAATAGVQQHDVLMFADDKQLTNKMDLSKAIQAAGEANANISLTLIRGGKEMSVVVKPEQGLAVKATPALMNLVPMDDMLRLNLPGFENDMFGKDMEARLRERMDEMRERMRELEDGFRNGMMDLE